MDRPAGLLSCSVDPRADQACEASLCPCSEKADDDPNEAQHAEDKSLLVQAHRNGKGQGRFLFMHWTTGPICSDEWARDQNC